MDGYRTDLLVSVCQDLFGVNFVILLDVLWPSKFLSWARVLDLVFVIIGLILPRVDETGCFIHYLKKRRTRQSLACLSSRLVNSKT